MTIALTFAFYSVMHSYHDALKKQEQLTKLFNNPKARVAAGPQGKAVLKELEETKKAHTAATKKATKKTVKKAAPAPKKVNQTEETLSKILKLLEEQNKVKVSKQEQQTAVATPVYQPPVLETVAPVINNN